MTVVLDTSALIYWTTLPDRLTEISVQAIDSAERIVISSISIWEIGIKVKKGHLEFPITIEQFAKHLESVRRVEIQAVDTETWLANLSLQWSHCDPADRTIVATAQILDAPLVTSDREMHNFYHKCVW